MKNKTHVLAFLVSAFLISGCATRPPEQDRNNVEVVMIDHGYFKIAYNKKRRLAEYVTYKLTADQLKNKSAKRNDKFIPDPFLVKKNIAYVVTSEYTKSGYDRGHLAPSADFAWNQAANDITFVMSNMAPQTPGLNRGAWKRLEDQVRKWACGEQVVTVITGPVLGENLPRLKSGLEVPQEFFKIVIDETAPKKAVAFMYHQNDKGDVMKKRVIGLEKVEAATGLAFNKDFPQFPQDSGRLPANLNEWAEADCN